MAARLALRAVNKPAPGRAPQRPSLMAAATSRRLGGDAASSSRRAPTLPSADAAPLDMTGRFAPGALRRKPSAIRALQPLTQLPGMISLGGGMPNPGTFPLTGATFTVRGGPVLTLTEHEMEMAMQYSATAGLPELVKMLLEQQQREHAPPTPQALCVTTGSQEALARAFELLLDPEVDTLLLEEPTYSGSLAFLKPLGCKLAGVETDGDGLQPNHLDHILSTWDTAEQGKKPHVLYVVPTGANPSGGTMGFDRRRQVYHIAQEHDLLILEDDPYYYLQLGQKKLPSLLSMDVDGRVLRFDSFSKVLSSGLRMGFATGPAALIDRIVLHTMAVNLHPSGLSQVAVLKLLEHWGPHGFNEHVANICDFYRGQRDAFLASAQQHLNGLAEWHAPEAGMFVWFKLNGVADSLALISERAVQEKVLLVPGEAFSSSSDPSPYVRAAYSTATPAEMDEAMRRLANILRSH